MIKENSHTDLGTIKIHKKVISSIASLAAVEIEGVKRVGGDLKSNLYNIIGKTQKSNIRVEFDKAGEVKIEIPLIIKYGYSIPEVASHVQENVRQALEKMTNVVIKDIDVNIKGIEKLE